MIYLMVDAFAWGLDIAERHVLNTYVDVEDMSQQCHSALAKKVGNPVSEVEWDTCKETLAEGGARGYEDSPATCYLTSGKMALSCWPWSWRGFDVHPGNLEGDLVLRAG